MPTIKPKEISIKRLILGGMFFSHVFSVVDGAHEFLLTFVTSDRFACAFGFGLLCESGECFRFHL